MRTVKFNLKAALANPERVVYRNGEKPKEWHWFKTAEQQDIPITSVEQTGFKNEHTKTGCYMYDDGAKHPYDLLLSEPKRKAARKK
jgi:hypothetical protein